MGYEISEKVKEQASRLNGDDIPVLKEDDNKKIK